MTSSSITVQEGAHWEIRQGDVLDRLREMPDESVQCCCTSPPYFGLRDYGVEGQIGLEESAEAFVATLVEVFAEVRRVLRADGTLWLNLGDSYACSWGAQSRGASDNGTSTISGAEQRKGSPLSGRQIEAAPTRGTRTGMTRAAGCKPKDLMGIPWMVAFALRADGWYLRRDIIWSKPNPMPESVTDRPTSAHEYIFLLSKSPVYYYDAESIREKRSTSRDPVPDGWATDGAHDAVSHSRRDKQRGHGRRHAGFNDRWDSMTKAEQAANGHNKRSVWEVAPQPYPEAHFATFPEALVLPMILAGCPAGGTVLDPFAGSGTTLKVAVERGRSAIGIELNPEYVALAERRLAGVTAPLFSTESAA